MILPTSPVTARPVPIAHEASRNGANAVQGESGRGAPAEGGHASRSGPLRSLSPADPVSAVYQSGSPQQARTVKAGRPDNGLSEQDRHVLEQLKSRDREVRSHEAAHLAVAGSHATSGARFTYQKGPDGQLYAIGGEVGVSTGKVAGDPQATLEKARQVRAAALAPANPSSQDRAIAARASQLVAEARREIAIADIEENTRSETAPEREISEQSTIESGEARGAAEQVYKSVSLTTAVQTERLLDIQV